MGEEYSVALWFWNGLPEDVRPVTGYLFARAGDRLGIGGMAHAAGRLFFESGNRALEGATRLSPRTWNFAVMNRGKKKLEVYLNGNLAPELSGEVPATGRAGEVTIGAAGKEEATFEGKIDEVAIFNRCLRAGEIASLHRIAARAPAKGR